MVLFGGHQPHQKLSFCSFMSYSEAVENINDPLDIPTIIWGFHGCGWGQNVVSRRELVAENIRFYLVREGGEPPPP